MYFLHLYLAVRQPHIFPLANAEKCTDFAAGVIICKLPAKMQKKQSAAAESFAKKFFLGNHLDQVVQVERTRERIVGRKALKM